MKNSGEKYTVPVKNLKEAQKLPPQCFFHNAKGVLLSHLDVKIKPNNQFVQIMMGNNFTTRPVYLVINYGYIFVYTKEEFGYALNIKAAGKIDKRENIKKNTAVCAQVSIHFKHAQLELEFKDFGGYNRWVNLLEVLCNPEIDRKGLKSTGLNLAGYKEQVTAQWVKPPVGQKKDSEWVEVLRYPSNTVDLDATVFKEIILEYEEFNGNEVFKEKNELKKPSILRPVKSTYRSPSRSSGRSHLSDARVETLPPDETSHLAAPSLLYKTPPRRSLIRSGRRQLHGSAARTPSTSRAPSIRSETRAASPISLRNESFSESIEASYALPTPPISRDISGTPRASPPRPISRTPSIQRSPSRTPSVRSEARAADISGTRTPSRAPTPRRAVAAAQPPRYY